MELIEIIIVCVIGWLAGTLVNLLADELPYRRGLASPVYADGSLRPILAWSGISAFLFKLRDPQNPAQIERERLNKDQPRLSWRYPITEIATIILMLLCLQRVHALPDASTAQLIIWLIYMPIFVLITVIDIEYKLILFIVMIPTGLLAILAALLASNNYIPNIQQALVGGVVGFVVFYLFYLGGFLFTYMMGKAQGREIRTTAFGRGDVTLMCVGGLMLGVLPAVIAMFLTVIFGALGAVIYLLSRSVLGSKYSLYTALPYGPYIVAAILLMLLYTGPMQELLLGYCLNGC
ncbi:hypothetical protein MASR2M15_20030 [Anaerolineales bacterium]